MKYDRRQSGEAEDVITPVVVVHLTIETVLAWSSQASTSPNSATTRTSAVKCEMYQVENERNSLVFTLIKYNVARHRMPCRKKRSENFSACVRGQVQGEKAE